MNTSVAKADASESACQVHTRPRFQILGVPDSPVELQKYGVTPQHCHCLLNKELPQGKARWGRKIREVTHNRLSSQ